MENDALQKIIGSTNRTITKISVKASSSLKKSKTKMHIESLTKDLQDKLSDVGEETYLLWTQDIDSIQSLTDKFEEIKKRKTEIEQLVVFFNSIDVMDNEILGTKSNVEAKEDEPTKYICSNCGYEYDPVAIFCRKCGYRLG